jgi:hypothetical protein
MKSILLTITALSILPLAHGQLVMPDTPPAPGLNAMRKAAVIPIKLTGVSDVRMNAAIASLDTAGTTPFFIFSNVRAVSSTTTLNDLLRVRYPVTKTTLNLSASNVEVFKDIGVFDEANALFMKNVPALPPMRYGTATTNYAAGVSNSFTGVNGTKPFIFDLQAGHVLGFTFTSLSTPCFVALTRSSTPPTATEYTGLIASNFYDSELSAISTGKYYLWMKPQTGTTATVRFSFHNENAGTMSASSLVTGSTLTGSLRSEVRDYLKWKVRLTKDQDLTLTQTSGSRVQWRLIADDSTQVGSFFVSSSSVTFAVGVNVPRTGDYYLVAEKEVLNSGTSIRATVKINP